MWIPDPDTAAIKSAKNLKILIFFTRFILCILKDISRLKFCISSSVLGNKFENNARNFGKIYIFQFISALG
jgi:hypothetical protein